MGSKIMEMVMNGGIDVMPLITATYSLDQFMEAMDEFDKNEDDVKIRLLTQGQL